jgi:hypothetical protein
MTESPAPAPLSPANAICPMRTVTDFKATLTKDEPPPSLPAPLLALWRDAKDDWDGAHRVAQDIESADGAWIHAYLHRKEGDASNAAYWYRRAGKPVARVSLEEEWEEIAAALLNAG